MSIVRWLARLTRKTQPIRRKKPVLRLEILEDRTVPSTVYWNNPSGGNFDNPSNWSNGSVPGSGDDAIINTSAAATILIQSGDYESVNSLTTAANDTLSFTGGGLTVAANSIFSGPLTMTGGQLEASGAAATLTANGATTVSDANLYAFAGGQLSLPELSSYGYAGNNNSFQVDGTDSVLDLSALTSVTELYGFGYTYIDLQATNGGELDLSGLTNLSGVSLQDTGGSTILNGNLTALSGVNVYLDGTDTQVANAWTSFTASSLTVTGGSYSLPGLTDVDGSNIYVSNGGSLSLPGLTSYSSYYNSLQVNGTGSVLDLSALTSVTQQSGSGSVSFSATNGGELDLSGLTSLNDASINDTYGSTILAGNLTTLTDGYLTVGGSTLSLPNLTDLDGSNIYVYGGGSLSLPELTSYSSYYNTLRVDGTGSVLDLSALTSVTELYGFGYTYIDLQATNGGELDLSGLTNLSGVSLQDTGGSTILNGNLTALSGVNVYLDGTDTQVANAWTSFTASSLTVTGGSYSLPGLTDVDGSNIYVSNGGSLSLPGLTSYSSYYNSLQVNGTGSVLDLSALTSVTQQSGSGSVSFSATNGGELDLSGLTSLNDASITVGGSTLSLPNLTDLDGSNIYVYGGGSLSLPELTSYSSYYNTLRVDGTGSVLDLSDLTSVTELYGFGYTYIDLQATNGGELDLSGLANLSGVSLQDTGGSTILDGNLTTLSGVNVYLDGTDTQVANAWTSFTSSSLTVTGGSYSLPGLTDVDGSNLSVSNSGGLALPGLTSYAPYYNSLSADGISSVLDLSHLITVNEQNGPAYLNASNGGEILLPVSQFVMTPASSSVQAGVPDNFTVVAKDAFGNFLTGYTGSVYFSASDGTAQFADAATGLPLAGNAYTFTTADAGTHTFTVTDTLAGNLVITATATLASSTAGVTVLADAPAIVTAQAGSSQSAGIGLGFSSALEATVTDMYGNPVSGVTVTFQAPTSGASGAFGGSSSATAITDANGLAIAPAFTADTLTGTYVVTAEVTGVATPANFSLTNIIVPAQVSLSLDPASDSGAPDNPGYTNVNMPTFDVQVNQPGTITMDFDGNPADDQTLAVAAGGTYQFTAPTLADGSYTATATFVTTIAGTAQNSTTYTIDTATPTVTAMTPTGTGYFDVSQVTLTFSELVDLNTFTPAAITFTGPNGAIAVNQPQLVSGTTYSISFPTLTTPGTYTLTVAPSVADFAGNPLNQTYIGSFDNVPSQVTDYWINPRDGNFDDPTNWSTGTVPGSSDDVVISTATAATITIQPGDYESVLGLTTAANDTLAINCGALTVSGNAILSGPLTMTGGSLTASGSGASLIANGTTSVSDASLDAEAGGQLALPGLTSYSNTYGDGTTFSVDGSGSVLNLSALASIDAEYGGFTLSASNGGELDLSELTSLAAPYYYYYGYDSIFATTGSEIDLSALTNLFAVYVTDTGESTILDGNLTALSNTVVMLDGTDTQVANTWTSFNSGSLTVTGGSYSLPGLTNVDYSSLYVSGGGSLDLPGLTSYTPYYTTLSADGAGSVLNLSALTNITSEYYYGYSIYLSATNGGTLNLSGLTNTTLSDGSITDTGASTLLLPGTLTTLTQVNVTLDGTDLLVTAPWTSLTYGSLTIDGGSVTLPGLTDLDGSRLAVYGGGSLSLPGLTSYIVFNQYYSSGTFVADGSGSVLDLSALTNITSIYYEEYLFLDATNGGSLNLSGLTSLADALITDTGESTLLDGNLTTLNVVYATLDGTDTQVANAWTSLTSGSLTLTGGSYSLPGLTDLNGSSVTVSDGGNLNLPGLTSYTVDYNYYHNRISVDGSGSVLNLSALTNINVPYYRYIFFSATNGGTLDLYGLTSLGNAYLTDTGGSTILDGNLATLSVVDVTIDGTDSQVANNWTSFTDSILTVSGGSYSLPGLTDVDGTSLYVSGGGSFNLPDLTGYATDYNNEFTYLNDTFSVDGTGSILNLGALADFTEQNGTLSLSATNGGELNLSGLTTTTLNGGTITDTGGSTILLPSILTTLTGVHVTVDGTDPLVADAWTSFTDGGLTLLGGSYLLPGLTDLDGSSLDVINGGSLSLSGVTSYTASDNFGYYYYYDTFTVQGAGSVLDLSALTTLDEQNGTLNLSATNGGELNLSGLTSVTLTGGSVTDTGGSTILLPSTLTTLNEVNVALDGTDPLVAEAWTSLTDGSLTITGGTETLPGLTDIDGSNLDVTNGGSLTFLGVTSYTASFNSDDYYYYYEDTFSVYSPGSVLDLSNLVNINLQNAPINLSATDGGELLLSGLTSLSPAPYTASINANSSGEIDLSGLTSLNDAYLYDTNGSTILDGNLTTLNGVYATLDGTDPQVANSWTSLANGSLELDGGSYSLPGLTDIDGSNLYVYGGSLSLPGVTSYSAADNTFFAASYYAYGAVLDLSALTTINEQNGYISLDVSYSGEIDVSGLTSLSGGSIYDEGYSTILDGNLSTLNGVSVYLDGTDPLVANSWTSFTNGYLEIDGGSYSLPGLTDIDGSSLYLYGGSLSLPGVTSYAADYYSTFSADYYGSVLDLSALTTINDQNGPIYLSANYGGEIDLSGLTSLSNASINDTNGSTLLDGNLTTLNGVYVTLDGTDTQVADAWTSFTDGSFSVTGGSYSLPGLTDIDGSSLYLYGGSLSLPGVTSYAADYSTFSANYTGSVLDLSALTTINEQDGSLSLSASYGGEINVSGLTSLSGGSIYDEGYSTILDGNLSTLNGVSVYLDGTDPLVANSWTSFTNGYLEIDGGSYSLPGLTDIDGSSLYLYGGSLSLPGVTSYAADYYSTFSADYYGSVLDLSALTTINDQNGPIYLSANYGGEIDLSGLTSLSNASINDTNGSTLLDGNLTTLNGVYVTLDGTDTQVADAWTSFTDGSFSVTGGSYSLPGLTDIDGSSLYVSNGGTLALPGVTSYAPSYNTLSADGYGSVLDLSDLTSVSEQNGSVYLSETNGGEILLSASQFALTSASSTVQAGTAVNFTLAAEDPFGNVVPGYTGTVYFSASDGTAQIVDANTGLPLTGNSYTFTSADAGVHTFTVTDTQAGTLVITATDYLTSTTGDVVVIAAAPASISTQTGSGQSAAVDTAYSAVLEATVEDEYGNPVSGVAVTFLAPTQGATGTFAGVSSVTVMTDANGVAVAPALTAGTTAGSFDVTASVTGVTTSASFSLTNLAILSVASTSKATVLQNVTSGLVQLATFNETGGSANAADYTATVAWGDGSSGTSSGNNAPVSITISGTQVIVSGTHTYATAGLTYPIVTLAYGGASVSTNASTIVIDVAADVTSHTKSSASPYSHNLKTKLTTSTLTVTNTGSTSLSGEFYLVLQGLTAGVTLQTASLYIGGQLTTLTIDKTAAGDPMIVIPSSLLSTLAKNQSFQVVLGFNDPSNIQFGYNTKLYSDPYNTL